MTGPVALVGGGPGDPGLLTLWAEALLAAAEIVVVDRPLLPAAELRARRAQLVTVEEGDVAEAELLAAVATPGTDSVATPAARNADASRWCAGCSQGSPR